MACDAGWFDDDGDDETGCEWAGPAGGEALTLRVDEGGEDVEERVGDHVYATLERAVAVAAEGDVIEIGRIEVVGSIELATPYLTVRGQGRRPTQVVRGELAFAPVLRVTGDFVRVEALSVVSGGGVAGVVVEDAFGVQIHDVLVEGGDGVAGLPLAGIEVVDGERVMLSDVEVSGLVGVAPPNAEQCPVADVVGLRLAGVEGWRAARVVVEDGIGAQGGACVSASAGGDSIGVEVAGASNGVLWGGSVRGLTGGTGWHRGRPHTGGRGGHALGVRLRSGARNALGALTIESLTGGERGCGERCGLNGGTFGVFIDPGGRDNRVDRSVTFDGVHVVYEHGPDCDDVEDMTLTDPGSTTNLGKIVLIGCRGPVRVVGNQVAELTGEAGRTLPAGTPGADGGAAVGIHVEDSSAVEVAGNTISQIVGGRGGSGATGGGPGHAIRVTDCTPDCRAANNIISFITGGQGGAATSFGDNGSRGGAGYGIHVDASEGLSATGNSLSDIQGGASGRAGLHLGGGASGLWIQASANALSSSNDVRRIRAGDGASAANRWVYGIVLNGDGVRSRNDVVFRMQGSEAAAFYVHGAGQRIEQSTVHDVRGTNVRTAVWAGDLDTSVTVFNSILSGAQETVRVTSPDSSHVTLEHVRYWPEDAQLNGAGVTAELNVEPRDPHFVDAIGGDLALQANSPCIDVGGGQCPDEPPSAEGGPICDLGHLGDTDQAHPRP